MHQDLQILSVLRISIGDDIIHLQATSMVLFRAGNNTPFIDLDFKNEQLNKINVHFCDLLMTYDL